MHHIDDCPFCGSNDVQLVHRLTYFVECGACYAQGPNKGRHHSGVDHGAKETEARAVNAWNNRKSK